ncbi:MAG: hypothetical protein COA45_12450 [Zetaproteobacteria bacterium]|nr:MAG: hypothetical protein COA45_12450 [Zetaproteobacteria bacterium]
MFNLIEERFKKILEDYDGTQEYKAFREQFEKIIELNSEGLSQYLKVDFEGIEQKGKINQRLHKSLNKHLSKSLEILENPEIRQNLNPHYFRTSLLGDSGLYDQVDSSIGFAVNAITTLKMLNDTSLSVNDNNKLGRKKGTVKPLVAYEIARIIKSILLEVPTSSENGKLKELYLLCCEAAGTKCGDDNRIILDAVRQVKKDYKKMGVNIQ